MHDDEVFTPDNVDEQIDRLTTGADGGQQLPSVAVVQQLHALYGADRRSTQRVWARLTRQFAHRDDLVLPLLPPVGHSLEAGATLPGYGTQSAPVSRERLVLMHPAPRQPHVAVAVSSRLRRSIPWIAAPLAAIVVAAFAFAFLAHAGMGSGPRTGGRGDATPLASPALTPASPVHEQAAYLGTDGRLHRVTLDGAHTTTGPVLPMTGFIRRTDTGWQDVAASPNGTAIAYVTGAAPTLGVPDQGGTGVAIVSVTTSIAVQASTPATDIVWSPDSTKIAADDYAYNGEGPVYLINPATGAVQTIQPTAGGRTVYVYRIIGWVDATHLAVLSGDSRGFATSSPSSPSSPSVAAGTRTPAGPISDQPRKTDTLSYLSGGPAVSLGVLDVGTGVVRHLVDLTSPPDVFMSPDGTAIFVAPSQWLSTGYLIDPTTGRVQPLPQISHTFASKFVNIGNADFAKGGNWASVLAWRPGTHTIALSLGAWGPGEGEGIGPGGPGQTGPSHQAAGVWLLNLDTDTATAVRQNQYPLAWTANGQSLLVSDLPSSSLQYGGLSVGPSLSALSPVAAGGRETALASDMVVCFGLVNIG